MEVYSQYECSPGYYLNMMMKTGGYYDLGVSAPPDLSNCPSGWPCKKPGQYCPNYCCTENDESKGYISQWNEQAPEMGSPGSFQGKCKAGIVGPLRVTSPGSARLGMKGLAARHSTMPTLAAPLIQPLHKGNSLWLSMTTFAR